MAASARWRGILRRVIKTLMVLVVAIAALVGVAIAVAHTDWGRDQIRAQLVSRVGELLDGTLEVGRLRGSVLGRMELEQVVIRDRQGVAVIEARTLIVDYAPTSLLDDRLEVHAIELHGARVLVAIAPDGSVNLGALLKTDPDDEPDDDDEVDSSGSGWTITIDRIALTDSTVVIEPARGPRTTVTGIDVAVGKVMMDGNRLGARLEHATATWAEAAMKLAVSGEAYGAGGAYRAELRVRAGDSTIAAPEVFFYDDGGVRADDLAVHLAHADASAVAAVDPALARAADLLADLDLTADVQRASAASAFLLTAELTAAGGSVAVRGHASPEARAAGGVIYGRGLRPAEVVRGAPELDVAFTLGGDARGRTLAELDGQLSGHLEARTDEAHGPVELFSELGGDARITIDASARDGRATGSLVSTAAGAVARTTAVARLSAEPLHLDELTVDGNVAPLAALLPPAARVRVRGPVQLSIHASGPIDAITADGTVALGRVRAGETSITSGTLEFDVTGIPAAPVGVAELSLRGVRSGTLALGPVRVEGRSTNLGEDIALEARAGTRATEVELRTTANIHRDEHATEIALGTVRARLRELVLTGSGGRITLAADGNLAARRVRLSSTAGRLTADGDLRRGLRVQLTGADVATLARAAAAPPGPTGKIDLEAIIRRRGATFGAAISGTATAVALQPGTARVDGTFAATVEPQRLSVVADFDGGALGSAHVDLDGRAPRDPTDVAAWIALAPRLPRDGHLTLTNVSVAQALAAARMPPQAAGRVDAELTLSGDGNRVDGTITLADARTPGLETSAGGTITVGLGGGVATVDGTATVREVGELTITGRGRIPARLSNIEAWLALDERAIVAFDASTSEISLDRLAAKAPTIPQLAGLGGTIGARVTATDRGELVTLDLTARGITGDLPRVPVDLTVHADVRRDSVVATVNGGFRGSPALKATATLGAGLRALRTPTLAAFERATLRGSADLAGQRLAVISAAIDPLAGAFTSGALTLRAVFGGTVGAPTANGTLELDRPTVAGVAFADVKLRGDARRNAVSGSIAARQQFGGRLTVRASADPGAVEALDAHVFASKFDLGFVSRFVPIETGTIIDQGGRLDGSVSITGTTERPLAAGRLALAGAEVRAAGLARPLTSIGVQATFAPGTIAITADTRSGAGSARAAGKLMIDGLELRSGSLSASTEKFPVLAGEMVLAVDAETTATMTATRRRMDIGIEVERALVIVPRKSTNQRELHEIRTYSDIVFVDAAARAEAAATRRRRAATAQLVTVAVRAPETIRVRGEEINAIVDVDLTTKLLPAGAAISGTVEITQGHLDLFDRRYEINTATMSFDGSIPPDPRLAVRLGHDFGDVTVFILVGGTLSNPKLSFAAEPALYDQATLLAIVLGQDPSGAENDETIGDRAVNLASGVLLDQLRTLAQDALPIDVLRLEEDTTDSGAKARRVVIGVWLTDDLFVAYRYGTATDVDDNSNQVEIEYRLNRRWRIEATYGDAGKGGADILWVKRY